MFVGWVGGESVKVLCTCLRFSNCGTCYVGCYETLLFSVSGQETLKSFTDSHLWHLGFLRTLTDDCPPEDRLHRVVGLYGPACIARSIV